MTSSSTEHYDSDTTDEEHMEWRRRKLSPSTIFRKLEARKLAELRDVAQRRKDLLKGATTFAEFLRIQKGDGEDVEIGRIEDVLQSQVEDVHVDVSSQDFRTPPEKKKKMSRFMEPTVASATKKARKTRTVRKKPSIPDVIRRSTRVSRKPERFSPS